MKSIKQKQMKSYKLLKEILQDINLALFSMAELEKQLKRAREVLSIFAKAKDIKNYTITNKIYNDLLNKNKKYSCLYKKSVEALRKYNKEV